MSTRVSWVAPSGGTGRRKMLLNVDLNAPPSENLDQEGTSVEPQVDQAAQVGQDAHQRAPPQLVPIDVESIDDDVILSSPREFAEAKNNSRRIHGRRVVDLDAEDSTIWGGNNHNKCHRVAANQQIINCETFVNLEGSTDRQDRGRSSDQPPAAAAAVPAPPPKEFTFNCPICMGPLVEEMTTRCGHIFCKACIKAAVAAQTKCPTCRRKVTTRDVFRIYLPATS